MMNLINKNILIICFALFCIILLNACSKKSILRKYYLLEIHPPLTEEAKSLSPDFCEVLPAEVAPAYAKHQIAVRQRSHEISYFQYHEWAMEPTEVFAGMLQKHLQSQRLFERVSELVLRNIPRYQARSSVFQLEAVDRDGDLYAHLSMQLILFDRALERPIVEHRFDRMQMLEDRDLNIFASAISLMAQEEFIHFSDKIRSYLTGKSN